MKPAIYTKLRNMFAPKEPISTSSPGIWGRNPDGSPYQVGMTVGELRQELARFDDADEVCVAVCQKRDWNGGGLIGKLKGVAAGSRGQIWMKALVLDKSLE